MSLISPTRVFCLLLVLVFSIPTLAAEDDMLNNDPVVKQTVNDVGLVVGAGAAGAIIGLSTLSFYQKPKEHWKNITVGGAVGVIAGVAAVVFLQATRSSTIEDEAEEEEAKLSAPVDFSTTARGAWHADNHSTHQSSEPITFQYSFTF